MINVKRAFSLEIDGTSIAGVRPTIIVSIWAQKGGREPDECSGLVSLSGFTLSRSAFRERDNFLLFLDMVLGSWIVSLLRIGSY